MKTIGIVGGGFSGTAVALHVARLGRPSRIRIYGDAGVGQGAAYSTRRASHLLNVPAGGMSAFEDDPAHFVRWLGDNGLEASADLESRFVTRRLYGAYLRDLLANAMAATAPATIECVEREVTGLSPDGEGVALETSEGGDSADAVVLALGNAPPHTPREIEAVSNSPRYIGNPWDYERIEAIDPGATVLIIGTGLTMIDTVLTRLDLGHRGPIHAVSRRGLMPQVHGYKGDGYEFPIDRMPDRLRDRVRFLRQEIRSFEGRGGHWRGVIDSMRPHTQRLWSEMPLEEKHRFNRKLRTIWDTHRHRIAPEVAARLDNARSRGVLTIGAGRLQAVKAGDDGLEAAFSTPHESTQPRTMTVDRVVNCTGPQTDYRKVDLPLLRVLFFSGRATVDPLALGLATDEQHRLVPAEGPPAPIYAVGPPCKGMLWEITAVPDIRKQAAEIAERLTV